MTIQTGCASCGIDTFQDEELCPVCVQEADNDLMNMALGSLIGRYDIGAAAAKEILGRLAAAARKPVEVVAAEMVDNTRQAVFTEVEDVQ